MWVEVLKTSIPVIGSVGVIVLGWYLDKRRNILNTQLVQREQNYRLLIESIKGFQGFNSDYDVKQKFIDQVNLLWLYAPDNVVRSAYAFVHQLDPMSGATEKEKKVALGTLISEIRKDLISGRRTRKTSLTDKEFKLYQV